LETRVRFNFDVRLHKDARIPRTYQGNVTTATDPAGIWKQYYNDAFGNLVTVVEPDPTVAGV
jgi:YD repeat-containing protein